LEGAGIADEVAVQQSAPNTPLQLAGIARNG